MKLFLLLSFQAAAAPAPAPAPSAKIDAIDFDLTRIEPGDANACDRSHGSEIVVCGHRKPSVYRLDRAADIYEPKPLRAEIGLGGGATANVHVKQVDLQQGARSNRIMVEVKLPF